MMFKTFPTQFLSFFLFSLIINQKAFAEDVTVVGTVEQPLKLVQAYAPLLQKAENAKKEPVIQLLKVELSDTAKEALVDQAQETLNQPQTKNSPLLADASTSASVNLGMNNVPVLDQGSHGTCVTFAVTGAMDATLSKGDYISQLCNLQLGSYLENHGYASSGWDGSNANTVINQIEQYGIVSKDKQQTSGCGGLTQYPTQTAHVSSSFMEPEQFAALSEPVFGKSINWSDVYQARDPDKNLSTVKESLQAGNRLVFAVLLPRTDLGVAGALAKHYAWQTQDTWVLTNEIAKSVANVSAAHEMIITGYDDEGLAIDTDGKRHRGLLTLRNSWGSGAGYQGDFYMSYDYFKLLTFDIKRFTPN